MKNSKSIQEKIIENNSLLIKEFSEKNVNIGNKTKQKKWKIQYLMMNHK